MRIGCWPIFEDLAAQWPPRNRQCLMTTFPTCKGETDISTTKARTSLSEHASTHTNLRATVDPYGRPLTLYCEDKPALPYSADCTSAAYILDPAGLRDLFGMRRSCWNEEAWLEQISPLQIRPNRALVGFNLGRDLTVRIVKMYYKILNLQT